MARHSSKHPTELELEILKVLWQRGESTVREVRTALVDFRDLAHTSVMTMMTIMTDKGYLKRVKKGNKYLYKACVTEKGTSLGMLEDIVQRVFQGSTMAAVVNLLEVGDVDPAELAELSKLIKKKEGETKP